MIAINLLQDVLVTTLTGHQAKLPKLTKILFVMRLLRRKDKRWKRVMIEMALIRFNDINVINDIFLFTNFNY